MIVFETVEVDKWVLTEEGQQLAQNGSHEYRVYKIVRDQSGQQCDMSTLQKLCNDATVLKLGQARAFKNKWLVKDGALLKAPVVVEKDETAHQLQRINEQKPDVMKELKKRKLCDVKKIVHYLIGKGDKFALTVAREETDITAENLAQLQLDDCKLHFKKYNFEAKGLQPVHRGRIHPLQRVRSELCQIFFELGFAEMPTNQYVESSFWNFDALFQPQDHPARDMHDTFFCAEPSKWQPEKSTQPSMAEYIERVNAVHSRGGYGSVGYGVNWRMDEAETLLLRTHTTAVSSAMLYKLFQQDVFTPRKYFSIDKVFRNETVDATHLAEFHQVEGLIADYNLTLGHLIGFLDVFFTKLGMRDLKFKPTYNPYTEPSLEVFAYHPGLGRQIELGNSGIFRPEMLRPMIPASHKKMHAALDKMPEDVRVIAWGLSLERPTMIRYGISNIRDLVGHNIDLEKLDKY